MSRAAKPAKRKVEAKPRRTRKSPKREGAAPPSLSKRLTEALEQQAATSEILRVISSSPNDVQPVFDTIVAAALKLCSARSANVFTFDGKLIHLAAFVNVSPQYIEAMRKFYPRPPSRDTGVTRAIQTCSVVAIPDVVEDREYAHAIGTHSLAGSFRSVLAVPLIRDGSPIGAIAVGRAKPGAFPDTQVELLKTFADQAVIAIENVRLFNELDNRNRDLTEALEQQTATSEILRVISQSPTDVQPVFDTIAAAALKLCRASSGNVYTFDGELIHLVPLTNQNPGHIDALRRAFPRPPSRDTVITRAILTCNIVAVADVLEDAEYKITDAALAGGFRSGLAVPLVRDGRPIGGITVGRPEPGPFPPQQIALLQTFADQAVIAIENVRLFKELETRNRDLTEALEQQTATSDILRVISQSQTDVQPVFDTIAAAALNLCRASSVNVFTFDGKLIHLAAFVNVNPEFAAVVHQVFPRPAGRDTAVGRVILARNIVAIPDVLEDREFAIGPQSLAGGFRSALSVPLMRDGNPIGAISVGRPAPGPFPDKQIALLQTFADQAVIAIENVRLFKELETRNRDLTEALEQQTATSDILRVISQSQTDVQPVFDTIAAAAQKLCNASAGLVFTFDGKLIHLAAIANLDPVGADRWRNAFPRQPSRDTAATRAVLTRNIVAIPDVLDDPDYVIGPAAASSGFRSALAVPLMREGNPIGVVGVGRTEPGSFPDKQIALLQTFADQAVIAIENVRLFKELETRNRDLTEALEQQTATGEILRAISSSQTDVQPVFDAIARNAVRLCAAKFCAVFRFDGEVVHFVAHNNLPPAGVREMESRFPMRPIPESPAGRAILTRGVVHMPDALLDSDYAHGFAELVGWREVLAVPMLREGIPVGAIVVAWAEYGTMPRGHEEELLGTFADQAVIAIENVRLFNETKEALEQQTATSDILSAISRSQTDAQPVFETIAAAALKLCSASSATVTRFDGELLHLAALAVTDSQGADAVRKLFPRPPSRDITASRAIFTGCVVSIPDVLQDPDFADKASAVAGGFRSTLGVPLIRDGHPIGAVTVGRPEPGQFPDKQIALLKTFADQAVIAIENARLVNELEARTTQLTRSVGELQALGEVGQAVSSTLDLETVLGTIVSRATRLAGMDGGSIYEYDEAREEFYLHTADRLPDELVTALRAVPIRKGEGALGRMAVTGEPVQVRDINDERDYQSRVRKILIRTGHRSLLVIPLLRENHLLGGLAVYRNTAGEFAPQVIELLKTFATQSALAIQNARLFREIETKGRQLEIASQHKSEFLANMSHELRTPLNAIIGFSEVLAERMFGEVNDKQAEYLADILESGRHLLSLINDILDLSKIEAGRMELEPSDFDLPSAIENTLILVRERAQRRAITLGRIVDKRVGTIQADERKVKQVLLNLLSNALKFTPEGGRIDVAAGVRDGVAEISVTDTGVGIAAEDQEAVFEEFRQVGRAAQKVEGTGLGLAISRKFIELHGGRIWVTSEVGKGSTFTFTLPLTMQSSPDPRLARMGGI